jgi:hypothetical protein
MIINARHLVSESGKEMEELACRGSSFSFLKGFDGFVGERLLGSRCASLLTLQSVSKAERLA